MIHSCPPYSHATVCFYLFQKLIQVLGCGAPKDDPTEKVVFVLTSNSFQKWLLVQGDQDRMFYNCDLENIGKQAFATNMWVRNSSNTNKCFELELMSTPLSELQKYDLIKQCKVIFYKSPTTLVRV